MTKKRKRPQPRRKSTHVAPRSTKSDPTPNPLTPWFTVATNEFIDFMASLFGGRPR